MLSCWAEAWDAALQPAAIPRRERLKEALSKEVDAVGEAGRVDKVGPVEAADPEEEDRAGPAVAAPAAMPPRLRPRSACCGWR